MSEETFVAFGLFAAVTLITWLTGYYNFKKRHAAHETIRHAITNGQPVSNAMIERVSQIADPARLDLRRGILFIAFGAAVLILGSIVANEQGESIKAVLGVASFPIIIGLTYLGLWRFGHDKEDG